MIPLLSCMVGDSWFSVFPKGYICRRGFKGLTGLIGGAVKMLIELALWGLWGSVAAHERYRCSPCSGNAPGFPMSATVAAHPVLGYKNTRATAGI